MTIENKIFVGHQVVQCYPDNPSKAGFYGIPLTFLTIYRKNGTDAFYNPTTERGKNCVMVQGRDLFNYNLSLFPNSFDVQMEKLARQLRTEGMPRAITHSPGEMGLDQPWYEGSDKPDLHPPVKVKLLTLSPDEIDLFRHFLF